MLFEWTCDPVHTPIIQTNSCCPWLPTDLLLLLLNCTSGMDKKYSVIFSECFGKIKNWEDETQELFIKVIMHAKKFDGRKSFSTWLYSIAHNMCKNQYRSEEVRLKYRNMKPETNQASHEKQIDLRRFREAVHACVDELNEEKRSLFILRFQEQMTVPDISRILELPEGTVKSRLFTLLKEMKDKLKQFQTLHNPL